MDISSKINSSSGIEGKIDKNLPRREGVLDSEGKKVRALSEDFEAVFLQIVLKSMRDSVQKVNLLGGSNGEDIFNSMLDAEYSKEISRQHLTGISKNVEEQLNGIMNQRGRQMDKTRGLIEYKLSGINLNYEK